MHNPISDGIANASVTVFADDVGANFADDQIEKIMMLDSRDDDISDKHHIN